MHRKLLRQRHTCAPSVRRISLWLSLFVGALLLVHSAFAQWYAPEDFARRRAKVMEQTKDGIVILLGAEMPDAYARFRQNNNFYYLTGVEVHDAILVLNSASKSSMLFVPDKIDPEIKVEARVAPGDEKKIGIDRILSRTMFTNTLTNFLRSIPSIWTGIVYTPFTPEELAAMSPDRAIANQTKRLNDPWDARVSRETAFINLLRQRFPGVTVKNLNPILDEMRWVKDEKEIAVLRRCVDIGTKGMIEAIKATRAGMVQCELEAVCNYHFQKEGALFPAYYPIIASGEDALIWHYSANNHKMNKGEVVLIDYAPEFEYMTCDLNRSWPVEGEFTAEQRKMYECILEASKEVIKAIKPGVTQMDLIPVMKQVYDRHGFADKAQRFVGHFVGMAVHDVGPYDKPFVPGVVFNVEPIIEDKEKKIHIRIEDTILVTKDGAERLSKNLPWEVEELYRLMREKRSIAD